MLCSPLLNYEVAPTRYETQRKYRVADVTRTACRIRGARGVNADGYRPAIVEEESKKREGR
jgi:hypothetical protein